MLAALALVAFALPVLPAAGDAPDAWTRDIEITEWLSAGRLQTSAPDATRWTTSPPVDAADVVLVGADWGGDPDVEVEVRGDAGDGWDGWHPLHLDHDEHEPDPWTAEAARTTTTSSPVWLGEVERLQVRVAGQVPDTLTLKTVGLTGGDGSHYVPLSMRGGAAADAAPPHPDIVPRKSWDPRGECTPRTSPSYASEVRFAYIHHTASSNSYGPSEGPSQVLSFCLYHRNSRGWDDIGYNFLVDKYGRIYEGRAGGITEPVIGAHAAGFNGGSAGVATIGNFESAKPTRAMVEGVRDLLAWKLDYDHIDPHGATREVSGGGGTNRIPRGERVTLPTIIGHRDTGTTACPGDHLYDYIDGGHIRDDVELRGLPKTYGGPPAHEEQPVLGERPVWRTKFSSPTDWRLEIRNEDGAVVRTTGGSDARGTDIAWDLRDATGREVPPGRYTATLEQVGRSASPVETVFDVMASTERRHGPERISTSVEMSQLAFSDEAKSRRGLPQSRRVIIAGAEAFPDALVATPLAASYDAPVLLSYDDGLSGDVEQEIRRLGAREAFLIGGPTRLSKQVERDLRDAGIRSIERLAGPTRYHTAGKVAWRIVEREHPKEALLALGQHPDENQAFQDALVAGAFGGEFELPVLLVQPNDLTEPSRWVLDQRPWTRGVSLIGGKRVVSEGVKRAAARAADASVREFAGRNRYETSHDVAEEQLKRWSNEPRDPNDASNGLEVVLATGDNWPDALGAGAAAIERGASFLLVPSTDLDDGPAARAWLQAHPGSLVHAVAAGGPNAISNEVLKAVDDIIRSDGPHREPRPNWPPPPGGGGSGGGPIALPTIAP